MSNSDTVIQQLSNQLEQDPLLAALLPLSLTVAGQLAKNQLDPVRGKPRRSGRGRMARTA